MMLTIDTDATYRPSESNDRGMFNLWGTKGASRFSKDPSRAAVATCAKNSAQTRNLGDMLKKAKAWPTAAKEERANVHPPRGDRYEH